MNEIYKIIEEFPNYEISNLGNVRNKKTKRVLKPSKDARGYCRVVLYKDGMPNTRKVHRLVMITFKPVEEMENLQVDHVDFNPENNCLDNLQWLSAFENGSKKSKSNWKKVLCVETGITYESVSDAARQTGISNGNISQCCNGKRKSAGGFHWEFVG